MSRDDVPERRNGVQWPMLIGLTVVWVLLWGGVNVANVLSGLVVAVIVTLVFPLPPIVFSGRLRARGLAVLLGWFVVELFVASVQVAGQALRIGRPPLNAVIEVDLRSRSDLYLTLTAELLSLVPGSLVVEARRSTSTLFLHVLGVRDEADVEEARRRALRQEERVMRALASDEELAAYLSEGVGR
ncbi:Na+/H+ antiporter subunit E [Jiangella alkaliphila]|uniref:Multisubunit sodium/proton antiporter, MrpE subunit n=1 Tax=Jiangella alkaliphila TaxID=419479 RepID=A0A1H2KPH0_9ACTN|nr:Na+/H+ antiporter subunit E [Jiangella alkaliphila]SDU70206.1 multisubunit sodium/proton antiporter, MrpE subunit [Jiangella alkaliphila]